MHFYNVQWKTRKLWVQLFSPKLIFYIRYYFPFPSQNIILCIIYTLKKIIYLLCILCKTSQLLISTRLKKISVTYLFLFFEKVKEFVCIITIWKFQTSKNNRKKYIILFTRLICFIFNLAEERCSFYFRIKICFLLYRNASIFLPNPFQRFSNKRKAKKKKTSLSIILMGELNQRICRTNTYNKWCICYICVILTFQNSHFSQSKYNFF